MTVLLTLGMFIRTVYKKNKKSSTKYECQQLVESIRTEKGVRQKLLLSLGRLPLPKEKWPTLTKRIEAIVQGQKALFKTESEIEDLDKASSNNKGSLRISEAEFCIGIDINGNVGIRPLGGVEAGVKTALKVILRRED